MSSRWLIHLLYLSSLVRSRPFLIMLHLSMRSWIYTWSCIWINSSSARWSLWLHLWLWLSTVCLLLLLLLLSNCTLGLQYTIDPLNEISSFRYRWTLRRWRWLLYMRNGVEVLWLSCFGHLVIVWMGLLLLLQESYWLGLSWNRWSFTLFSYYLETLRCLLHGFSLFTLRTINLLKYWVLNASKTKTTVQHSSAIIFVSLSETWILVKLSEDFIQRWNRCLSFHF